MSPFLAQDRICPADSCGVGARIESGLRQRDGQPADLRRGHHLAKAVVGGHGSVHAAGGDGIVGAGDELRRREDRLIGTVVDRARLRAAGVLGFDEIPAGIIQIRRHVAVGIRAAAELAEGVIFRLIALDYNMPAIGQLLQWVFGRSVGW
jgi:hypothetical protein